MAVCIICSGSGFTLYDGLCDECNGTGESDFDYDTIIFKDDFEAIPSYKPFDFKLFRYHGYNMSPKQPIG